MSGHGKIYKRGADMNKIIISLILILSAMSSPAFSSEGIRWLSLKDGMEKAKLEKKPMIVDFFFGKGCPRCESLQKNVYDKPSIAKKIAEDFIPVMVDLTKKITPEEEDLGKKYDFKNDCLLLFLDHNGNIIKDPSGKRLCFVEDIEPELFIRYLDMIKAPR